MKNHVNSKRNDHGRAWLRKRVKELERANRHAPVVVYNINSPTFVIYCPRHRRRKEGK